MNWFLETVTFVLLGKSAAQSKWNKMATKSLVSNTMTKLLENKVLNSGVKFDQGDRWF